MLKSWCACLQVAITCEHGRCIFWNFSQSHYLSSNMTTNFPTGRTSLGLTISSTLNLVVFLSNSTTWCVLYLESASYMKLVAYSEYAWPALAIAVICLPLFVKYVLHLVYVANIIDEMGKFLVFFRTKFIASARFVVTWPHLLPWSYARHHCSLGIWSTQAAASGLSSLMML